MRMPTRVEFAPVEGAAALFTPPFCEYLTRLHDRLDRTARDLRKRRLAVLERALKQQTADNTAAEKRQKAEEEQRQPEPDLPTLRLAQAGD